MSFLITQDISRPCCLLVLLLITSCTAQNCRLTLNVFDNSNDCENNNSPDSVGLLKANGQCNAVKTLSGSSNRLPGIYTAKCVSSERVRIYQSGCTYSDCSSSDGGSTCDRDFDIPSLYARLSPPVYAVQSEDSSSRRCFALSSNDDSLSITFYITGDCSACLSGGDDDGNGAMDDDDVDDDEDTDDGTTITNMPTESPTFESGVSPGTFSPVASPVTWKPTRRPSQSPTAANTPAPALDNYAPALSPDSSGGGSSVPTTNVPTLLNQFLPTPRPTDDDVLVNIDDDFAPFATPARAPASPSGVTSPDVAPPPSKSAPASLGVIVGVAFGVIAILGCVLLAGFILGKRLQSNGKNTRGQDFEQSLAGRVRQPIPPSHTAPETSFMTPTDRFINVDRQDDISILEDPTIFTRDNTVTKMMREAEDQETVGGLETTDLSMQAEDNVTVDRSLEDI